MALPSPWSNAGGPRGGPCGNQTTLWQTQSENGLEGSASDSCLFLEISFTGARPHPLVYRPSVAVSERGHVVCKAKNTVWPLMGKSLPALAQERLGHASGFISPGESWLLLL